MRKIQHNPCKVLNKVPVFESNKMTCYILYHSDIHLVTCLLFESIKIRISFCSRCLYITSFTEEMIEYDSR